jgi:hypothetical protein
MTGPIHFGSSAFTLWTGSYGELALSATAGNWVALNVNGLGIYVGDSIINMWKAVDAKSSLQVDGSLTANGAFTANGTATLSADPTTNMQAATKQYVDNHIAAGAPYSGYSSGITSGMKWYVNGTCFGGSILSDGVYLVADQNIASNPTIYFGGGYGPGGAWTQWAFANHGGIFSGSARRRKRDIVLADAATTSRALDAVNVYRFAWNESPTIKHFGFVVDELAREPLLDGAVGRDEQGEPSAFCLADMLALAIAELKRQGSEIKELKAQLAAQRR